MELKPQDILIALKLCTSKIRVSYTALARSVGISASEAHAGVSRLTEAGLVDPDTKNIHKTNLRDFLIHGVPYAFPVKTKEVTRGMPTAWAAPVMVERIVQTNEFRPVWPDPEGKIQGVSVHPLYSSVVKAATNDSELYDLLALVDAIRLGRAREKSIAEEELTRRLIYNARD